jgi:uncharacterized protein
VGRAVATALIALCLGLGLAGASPAYAFDAAACAQGRVLVTAGQNTHAFSVEIADTEDLRAQGLMNRASLPSAAGMLFVYPAPMTARFWMENTLIPLDMIFAGPDGQILHVHENAIPLDRTTINGGAGVKYVLEINGGLSSRLGIAVGGALHHPVIAGSGCTAG